MPIDPATIDRALCNAQEQLLAVRVPHGGWKGELASSALATATAVFALGVVDQKLGSRHQELIQRGLAWLVDVQNSDGGWGDTPASFSNISTTSLGWGALVLLDHDRKHQPTLDAAAQWLRQAAGSLDPQTLAEVIARRYGKDRTFSVPILSLLAMAGCLGDEESAWRHVPQLPFELAACPHNWFNWLRLPVVSYALPALIALGYLRHQRLPSHNPVTRVMRRLVTQRVLRKLCEIQPTGGGFLEATPLTSFVVMSLVGSGEANHSVVDKGIEFLTRSQRTDGSWPIDTNLATWVSTLGVNALGLNGESIKGFGDSDRDQILSWLLDQQQRDEHPYTHAAPGGWAWTDLPGGVPDADDTSGALLALHLLAGRQEAVQDAAANGIAWLLDLQNRDGGVPTFCRGWGRLPFDRSSPDITAHTVRALSVWRPYLNINQQSRCSQSLVRMLRYLANAQQGDGTWLPLWFGNQYAPAEENPTYGTSRVLRAAAVVPASFGGSHWRAAVVRGCNWLIAAQNQDGGWGGAPNTPSSIEETALSLESLAALMRAEHEVATDSLRQAIVNGAAWLCDETHEGRRFPPSPIGLYFAKLWYHERLYPLIYSVAAFGQLSSALHKDRDNALL